jgi:hypothetical protein
LAGFLIIGLLTLAVAALFAWGIVMDRISHPRRRRQLSWAAVLVLTVGYWAWESRAAGNIRVDLLALYPILFFTYIRLLWPQLRWLALLAALLLMAVNAGFFVMSYSWFHKNPG